MFFLKFQSDCCRQSDFLGAPEDKNHSWCSICAGVRVTPIIKNCDAIRRMDYCGNDSR